MPNLIVSSFPCSFGYAKDVKAQKCPAVTFKSMMNKSQQLIEKHDKEKPSADESEIRTRASEKTGALNQRLRPLGHLAMQSRTRDPLHLRNENGLCSLYQKKCFVLTPEIHYELQLR